MVLTKYNGYDCAKDPRHAFTPEDLESMAAWDAKIDAEPDGPAIKPTGPRYPRQNAYYHRNKEMCVAKSKAYYEAHKDQIKAYKQMWHAARKGVTPCSPPPSDTTESPG